MLMLIVIQEEIHEIRGRDTISEHGGTSHVNCAGEPGLEEA